MKLRSSTKIAVGFVAVCAGGFYAYKGLTNWLAFSQSFPPIAPGTATLLGIDPGSGYRIIVANDAAALVHGGTDQLNVGEMSESVGEDAAKSRIPIKAMLDVLRGDEKPLGRFIMALNEMREGGANDPVDPAYWSAEDVAKALGGDAALQAKLERDLNIRLDGSPLPAAQIDYNAIVNGIVVRLPVTVDVRVGASTRKMTGRVDLPYRPRLSIDLVDKRLKEKFITPTMVRAYYEMEAKDVLEGRTGRENVRKALESRISRANAAKLAAAPAQILSKARIVLNSDQIESADADSYVANAGKKRYKLVLHVNSEGRQRLWQYSKLNPGTQLLFVVNGTAIAAPTVGGELSQADVSITNLRSEDLVQEAVRTINATAKGKGK